MKKIAGLSWHLRIAMWCCAIIWANGVAAQDWNQSFNKWNHNGSIVFLEWKGPARYFYYVTPRPGIAAEGARPGTLLFTGTRSGHNYTGTAYLFSSRCGAVGYSVQGSLAADLRSIRLAGRAPQLDAKCNVVSYFDDVLTFTAVDDPYCGCACPGEIPVADLDKLVSTGEATSCPYFYAWSDSERAWTSYGKVLHFAEGRRREAVEEVKLKELATRFRLAEEEPENAFVDHVQLRLETADGAIFALTPDLPELSRRDSSYAYIPAHKSIEFRFTLPDWLDRASVRQSTLVLTGYYERIHAPVCMPRVQVSN